MAAELTLEQEAEEAMSKQDKDFLLEQIKQRKFKIRTIEREKKRADEIIDQCKKEIALLNEKGLEGWEEINDSRGRCCEDPGCARAF